MVQSQLTEEIAARLVDGRWNVDRVALAETGNLIAYRTNEELIEFFVVRHPVEGRSRLDVEYVTTFDGETISISKTIPIYLMSVKTVASANSFLLRSIKKVARIMEA